MKQSKFDERSCPVDHVHSYDSACSYCINIHNRFLLYLPDYAFAIPRIRFGIPAVHVMNHIEDCLYCFGMAYMRSVGHFHGETAEHYWAELNQLGKCTRQMNNGHRQDIIIDHHSDWNWKKLTGMGMIRFIQFHGDWLQTESIILALSLRNGLEHARRTYIRKRNHFAGLSNLYSDRVAEWRLMNRSPRKTKFGVESVYRHSPSKR